MTIAEKMTEEVAQRLASYRAYQVCSLAKAMNLDPNELVLQDRSINGLPLSKHSRASLRAAIMKANLKNAADKLDGGNEPPDVAQAKRVVRRFRTWAKHNGMKTAKIVLRVRDWKLRAHLEADVSEIEQLID